MHWERMLTADGVPITPMEKEIFPFILQIQQILDQYRLSENRLIVAEYMVTQMNERGYPGTFAIDWTPDDNDEDTYLVSFEYPPGQSPYPQKGLEVFDVERPADPKEMGGQPYKPADPINLN